MEGRTHGRSRVPPAQPPAAMVRGGGVRAIGLRRRIRRAGHDIFVFDVFGERVSATVTRCLHHVHRWIHRALYYHRDSYRRGDLVAGLGVQWRFDRGNAGKEPAATIQICIECRCLIFQISRAGRAPTILERFFADPSVTFVNVGIGSLERRLQEHWELSVANSVDLGRRASIGRASLQEMASTFLGWNMLQEKLKPEGVGRSDWEAESLVVAQIRYACLDAYTSFLLEKKFRELCGDYSLSSSSCS